MKNVILLGACNPYRKRKADKEKLARLEAELKDMGYNY